jgi:cyclic beta-1,2-glucan synthetase
VLDELVPFLKAPPLTPEQEEVYGLPAVSEVRANLYEHCVRALENGWKLGQHGLPLMGTGDWNDGMNRVGNGGRGESVWLGWFLLVCLQRFADLAKRRDDGPRAELWQQRAEQLRAAIEEHAWDGRWYRRAYFDDGTPLGSSINDECRIDSLAQTWAVIAGVADPDRARQAMTAVEEMLIRRDEQLVRLFTPPFDNGPLHPGYIKGYVPGIRENGGQYTHGAAWVVEALALLGQGGKALEVFQLLNPIRHTTTPEQVGRYRVEPYVVVADVYSEPPHVGRGGWTWYTGSAGWLYRIGLETILGFHRRGDRLEFDPRIPANWKQFTIDYRHGSTRYHITVENPHGAEHGVSRTWLDGQVQDGTAVPLADDGKEHQVRVEMGR